MLYCLNWLDCLVYLDDIIIFAKTFDEHYQKLDKVLTRLEKAGLKLNAQKCQLLNRPWCLDMWYVVRVFQLIQRKLEHFVGGLLLFM